MGYLYVIITTLMFSLIGTCVTLAKSWVSSDIISFGRFFVGVLFLVSFMLISRKKISLKFTGGAIWLGVACKCINYLTENYAIAHGYSFGNIVVWPVQCVAILLFALFFLHEKISPAAITGVILCVLGVATAMEFKDYKWGGEADWKDWLCTMMGGTVGQVVQLLIVWLLWR